MGDSWPPRAGPRRAALPRRGGILTPRRAGQVDLAGAVALVVGAEGKGLRPLVAKACGFRARIPMTGKVASLNVSAAAAVLLYEAMRQRAGK